MRWQTLRGYADPALGIVVLALYAWEVSRWNADRPGLLLAVAAVGSVGLALRRRTPLVAFLLCGASIQGITAFAPGFDNDSAALVITFGLSLYSLGRYAVGLEQWLGVVALIAVMVSFVLSESNAAAVDSGDVGFVLLFAGTPWAAGVVVRLRLERERLLRERNAALQRDQEAKARAAVAAERARIARELHDVVAHAISVTVMQARGGRAMLGRDEEEVRRALDAIEQTNTAALSDMRRLLAVLRDTEDRPDGRAAPQPSLANLEHLVGQVRAAGLPVELAVTGTKQARVDAPVPPGVDLSGYRIVQEALTNVLKHAGPTATARVEVEYGADSLRVTVLDDGVGPLGPIGARDADASGHGLVGIRERVAVIGGRVEAGAGSSGDGFVVTAVLPYALEASTAPEVTA